MRTTPFTPDELAHITTTRDEWMRIGLSTDPIDRAEAEAAIRTVYRTAGTNEPRIWIWMTSPLGDGSVAHLIHTDEHGCNAVGPGVYVLHGKREQAEEIRRVAD